MLCDLSLGRAFKEEKGEKMIEFFHSRGIAKVTAKYEDIEELCVDVTMCATAVYIELLKRAPEKAAEFEQKIKAGFASGIPFNMEEADSEPVEPSGGLEEIIKRALKGDKGE